MFKFKPFANKTPKSDVVNFTCNFCECYDYKEYDSILQKKNWILTHV